MFVGSFGFFRDGAENSTARPSTHLHDSLPPPRRGRVRSPALAARRGAGDNPPAMRNVFRTVAVLLLASALIARGDITLAPPDKKKADKREQPAPPPRAVPAGAKVARGGSVEIVLRAAGGGLMPVKFLIRA